MGNSLKLTNESVIEIATRFLEKYQPNALRTPQQTDLVKILDLIKDKYGYNFLRYDLGYESNSKVLGITNFKEKYIAIDKSFEDDVSNKLIKVPFVISHEIGHCIIHGPKYNQLKMAGIFDQITTDTTDFLTGKRIFQTDRDFIENQANVFASALLVPSSTLSTALKSVQKNLGINIKRGIIYVDHNAYNRIDLHNTLIGLKKIYMVSKELLRIRLKQNSLLIEKYEPRKTSIGNIMLTMNLFPESDNWLSG